MKLLGVVLGMMVVFPPIAGAQEAAPTLPRVRVYAELTPPCDSARAADTARVANLSPLANGYACYDGIGGMMVFTARSDSAWAGIVRLRTVRRSDSSLAVARADYDQSDSQPAATDGPAEQLPSWGLDTSRVQRPWTRGVRGAGVKVAVIDGGFAIDHPAFAGRIAKCVGMNGSTIVDTAGACKQVNADCKHHGSHVASTVASTPYGMAPDALLVLVNNYVPTGDCLNYASARISAEMYSATQNVRVVNLSTGTGTNIPSERSAITTLRNVGIVTCAANGNGGSGSAPLFPARFPESFGIAAMTSTRGIPSYSQRDSTTDFTFPGSSIVGVTSNTGAGSKTGTSMATPHCSGLAALAFSANPLLTVDALYHLFRLCALDLTSTPGRDNASGWGFPRADCVVARARGESLQPTSTAGTLVFQGLGTQCAPVDSPVEWTLSSAPGFTITREVDRVCLTNTDPTPRSATLSLSGVP